MKYSINETDINNYNDSGYLLLNNFFHVSVIKDLKSIIVNQIKNIVLKSSFDIEKRIVLKDDDDYLNLIHLAYQLNNHFGTFLLKEIMLNASLEQELLELIQSTKMLNIVDELISNSTEKNLLLKLRPHVKSLTDVPEPWHQDLITPETENTSRFRLLFTCWIPIVNINLINGPICIIPKSHLNGPYPHHKSLSHGNYFIKEELLNFQENMPIICDAGSILIFDKYLPHAVMPNMSSRVRWVLIIWGFANPTCIE